MTPQKYSQLKAKILEACPELTGKHIFSDIDHRCEFCGIASSWKEIIKKDRDKIETEIILKEGMDLPTTMTAIVVHDELGKDCFLNNDSITLADILRAMEKNGRLPEVYDYRAKNLVELYEKYDLKKDSLDEQSDELKDFLYSLLCNE